MEPHCGRHYAGRERRANQLNTAGLRSCAYALRLVVADQAVLNCNSAIHNQREYLTLVNVGKACDVNTDGFVNGLDVQPFVACLLAGP